MSDYKDEFMFDEDEDYYLEYSEDSNSEPDVDLENQYYNSKVLKEENPKAALDSFQRVLDLENAEKGEWGFKALKQMIKMNFRLENFDETMRRYKQLLTYIKSAVTRNHSEKSITSILNYISTSKQMELLQNFYETTLDALRDAKNEQFWFKTMIKLGKLYFDHREYGKLSRILKQLHTACTTEDGEYDLKKGTQLLEIYALEIQMYTSQKNNKKVKTIYDQSLDIKSVIPHPLILGVVRECGGKMHLRENEYEKAHTDFFEAFKNYDESGSPRRTTCLKYLILANMLMKSGINPFNSQEAKPYKNNPEILAITNLVSAYQNHDIKDFEKILKQNRETIMDDLFIHEQVEDLLKNIHTSCKMEEAFLRFPHLSEAIFKSLNNKTLADCKEVSKSWYFHLDSQKFLETRIVKTQTNIKDVEEAIVMVRKIYFEIQCNYSNRIWDKSNAKFEIFLQWYDKKKFNMLFYDCLPTCALNCSIMHEIREFTPPELLFTAEERRILRVTSDPHPIRPEPLKGQNSSVFSTFLKFFTFRVFT